MLLHYQHNNSQTWRDEYSVLLFTKQKINSIFCCELAVNNAASNTLNHFLFVLLKRPKYPMY